MNLPFEQQKTSVKMLVHFSDLKVTSKNGDAPDCAKSVKKEAALTISNLAIAIVIS